MATTANAKILNTASLLMMHLIQQRACRLKRAGCHKFLRTLPQLSLGLAISATLLYLAQRSITRTLTASTARQSSPHQAAIAAPPPLRPRYRSPPLPSVWQEKRSFARYRPLADRNRQALHRRADALRRAARALRVHSASVNGHGKPFPLRTRLEPAPAGGCIGFKR